MLPGAIRHIFRKGPVLFKPSAFSGALSLVCLSLALPARAQLAPIPDKAASDPTAIERSQRQADNVYRWIKYFADQPKKPDANKPRAKTDMPGPASARKPELNGPATAAEADGVAVTTPEAALSTAADVQQPQPVNPLPAVASVVTPAAAEPEVVSDTARPLVPIAVVEPTIPYELRNETINAKVRLSFTVQPDGTVAKPSVISGSSRRLDRSAIEAIAKWRFEPIRSERVTQIEFQFTQE
jgi:TonB family protein